MNCLKCNQPIETDSKFCKHCGATVGQVAPPRRDTQPADVGQVSPPRRDAPSSASPAATQPDPYRDPAYEKEVWQGRPAWRAAYGVWFLWAVASLLLIYAVHHWEAGDTVKTGAWLLIAAAAVVILIRQAGVRLSHRYRLTTQRLFIHRGILARVTDQMELVRVDDVRMRQGIIDRLVNTGDIEIIGSDKTDDNVWLESVGNPADVAEALRRNVRAARSKGTLFVENV